MTPEEQAVQVWYRISSAGSTLSPVALMADALRAARLEALEEAVKALKDKAKRVPLGSEDLRRGASTYNWLMYAADIVRELTKEGA